MTPQQLDNLRITAKKVMSDKPNMPVLEMINRIHLITGRDVSRCVEGYRIMRQEIIPDEFVRDLSREQRLLTVLSKKPMGELMDRFGVIFVNTDNVPEEPAQQTKQQAQPQVKTSLAERLNLQTDF